MEHNAAPVAVLINPTAGKGRYAGRLRDVIAALSSGERAVRLLDPPDRPSAVTAAHDAVRDGASALVSVGGDGTLHLALQAVAGTGTPLGLIPCGTGNDFAVALGVPADPLVAARGVAKALDTGSVRTVDLARATTPDGGAFWYGAVLAAGFDAMVNERANRMRFPRGPRRYEIAIMAELARLRAREYTITLDGEVRRSAAILVAVGNTMSYGGGMRMCPAADPTDGLLDVVIGGPMSRRTMMRLKPRLRAGTHVDDPLVTQFTARTVMVDAPGITTYADGERTAPLPVTITSVPGALTLLGGAQTGEAGYKA